MILLEVNSIKKKFSSHEAVKGISFSVKEGEVLGLLGPNGAGKSTTLSIISGLIKPNSGSVTIQGWDMNKQRIPAKKLIGIVPQEPALYPQLSARENLVFWGTMNDLKGKELTQAVDEALNTVGLTERAKERINNYSGGMKRRLNIAAGILHKPKLIIMDEPTVGVDPQSRNHILDTIKNLNLQGTSVIYTSHYVEEVESLCDRVLVMDHGEIISEGTISELLSQAGEFQELIFNLNSCKPVNINSISVLPGVTKSFLTEQLLKILTSNAEQTLPLAFEAIVEQGHQVKEIKIHKPNLESLFLKLTGRALRD